MVRISRSNIIVSITLSSILLLVASLFKVSFILGSKSAFFSGVDILSPLSGALGGFSGTLLIFSLRYVVNPVALPLFFLRHLPTLCGAWYWVSFSRSVRVFLPVLCMVLFLLHPVGIYAFGYSFFWLIPVALSLFKVEGLYAQALGSTFVTHAVGSVIWLYTVPMTVMQWWALIPVVILERLVFASLQVVALQFSIKGNLILNQYSLYQTTKKQLAKVFS